MVSSKQPLPSDYYPQELSERVKSKSKQAFLKEVNELKSHILKAYEVHDDLARKSETDWVKHRQLYEELCKALLIFVGVTDWLYDLLLLSEAENREMDLKLEKTWIAVARGFIKSLQELTPIYTTYEDSLGWMGDTDISHLFLEAYGRHERETKPHLSFMHASDSLGRAAKILFRKSEFRLASRYALMSAIEAIWNSTDKDDVLVALDIIPSEFTKQGMNDESVGYQVKILEWLYACYSEWEEQRGADWYIRDLQSDLIGRWGKLTDKAKRVVIEFWKNALHREPYFFDQDFVLSTVIDELASSDRYREAFEVVERRITLLATHPPPSIVLSSDKLLQELRDLAKLGFNLKDRDIESLKETLDEFKSRYLENKVSELADRMGFKEHGELIWKFKDPILHKFIKNKKTNTVEIDVHQSKTEYSSGKERRILFMAECKYTAKPVTMRDVNFFSYKAKDLFMRLKTEDNLIQRS